VKGGILHFAAAMELINRSAAERACAAHCYAEPAGKTATLWVI